MCNRLNWWFVRAAQVKARLDELADLGLLLLIKETAEDGVFTLELSADSMESWGEFTTEHLTGTLMSPASCLAVPLRLHLLRELYELTLEELEHTWPWDPRRQLVEPLKVAIAWISRREKLVREFGGVVFGLTLFEDRVSLSIIRGKHEISYSFETPEGIVGLVYEYAKRLDEADRVLLAGFIQSESERAAAHSPMLVPAFAGWLHELSLTLADNKAFA